MGILFRQFCVSVAVLAAGLGLSWVDAADQIQPGATPGVLLLRNGEVLAGKITQVGDKYHVVLPDGEIRIRSVQVELFCRDLEEAYQRKRAAVESGNVNEHVELATWCERHGLIGQAARELADAMAADPTHPMIGLLERRLRMSRESPAEKTEATGKAAPSVVSPEDLDRLVRGVPRSAMETFAQTIQPMLVNGCTAVGCHGSQSKSEFSLFRIRPGRSPSRRLTQRNLYATLQCIDQTDPAASKLLTAPIRPHGTAKAAVFTNSHMAQYRQLVNWVHHMVETPQPRRPATIQTHAPDSPPALQIGEKPGFDFPKPESVKPESVKPTPVESATPAAVEKAARALLLEAEAEGEIVRPVKQSTVKRGKPPKPFIPADPFDPEIFNRRLPAGK